MCVCRDQRTRIPPQNSFDQTGEFYISSLILILLRMITDLSLDSGEQDCASGGLMKSVPFFLWFLVFKGQVWQVFGRVIPEWSSSALRSIKVLRWQRVTFLTGRSCKAGGSLVPVSKGSVICFSLLCSALFLWQKLCDILPR